MSMRSLMSVHLVDVEQETVTRGTGLGVERAWATSTSDVPCRVVPVRPDDVNLIKQEGQRTTYFVYFADNPALTQTHRLVFTDENSDTLYLYVQKQINPDHLDRYWRAECEWRGDVDER